MNPSSLHLLTPEAWAKAWAALPEEQQSIFLHPNYYKIFEQQAYGHARCIHFSSPNVKILYPFLQRDLRKLSFIKEELYDIEGAYGLNGASIIVENLSSETEKNKWLAEFNTLWQQFCVENKIIAEFTRLNPMIDNAAQPPHWNLVRTNQVIAVDLQVKDFLYDSYEHSVRKSLKKAERAGLTVVSFSGSEIPEKFFHAFLEIYHETMTRNSADSFYFFNRDFFEALKTEIPEMARWFFTISGENIVSAEIVLHDKKNCYSYLGGTKQEHLNTGANALLKHQIHLFFQKKNLNRFCIGGGITEGDGIFRYKKTFSKLEPIPFYIGKTIHLAQNYEAVVSTWSTLFPEKITQYKNFLLKYWK